MGIFGNKKREEKEYVDFSYIDKDALYFDSACQTLRPQSVIDAMVEYFHEYNSCGGRVKYDWGKKVDEKVSDTKKEILNYLGKSSTDYSVAFTLNATTGINIILGQLPSGYKNVVTTEIEHNSVFLTTISLAKRLNIERKVIPRNNDGSIELKDDTFDNSIFVANNISNIDGRELLNLIEVTKNVHSKNGLVIIDAAQGFLYGRELLQKSDFDALAFSGHKIYGPSIGVIVIKNKLLEKLERNMLGGGMVEDVTRDDFTPVSGALSSSLLEMGLQDYAGIIGLKEALSWNKEHSNSQINELSEKIISWLRLQPDVHVINESNSSPVISFYSDKIDSHDLAIYLSEQGIMTRSGYYCCHYYLKHVKQYPPLLRISLGKHNDIEQVNKFINILGLILNNIK